MYANHVHLCSYPHCKTRTLGGLELKMMGKGKNKKQKTNNESLLDIFSRQVAEYSQELKTILQNASK